MRPSVLVLAFFGVTGLAAACVSVACSSGSAPPQEANGTSSDQTGSPASTGAEGPSASEQKGADPSRPDNGEPGSDITNDPPDGGVVMNNATTSGDAGSSDRVQPMMDLVAKNRDKYRACFDLWGKKNPSAGETKVTFTIKLGPAGELEHSGFKADESDITDKSVETCMIDVTKSIKWPPSPSDKVTTYHHPFKFKPRK